MQLCSCIIPCYNEEESILYFYNEMLQIIPLMDDLEFEIIFIDDGSTDGTLEMIKKLKREDKRIGYISFSRNFGKEAAIYAGLKQAQGAYIVTMDVDLQDPPALLPEMYHYIKDEDYDCVASRRVTRKGEPVIRSFFARIFYKMINQISKTEIVDGARDYRFMSRQFVNAILSMKEYNRFLKGIYGWVGFKTKWLEFDNRERVAGESKWSFSKLFIYSLEGILGFSTTPLAIASIMGLVFFGLAFFILCGVIIRASIWGDPVAGWPSLVCLILFTGGIQLFCTGILGLYLSKTYLETKKRPIYIVKEIEISSENSEERYYND